MKLQQTTYPSLSKILKDYYYPSKSILLYHLLNVFRCSSRMQFMDNRLDTSNCDPTILDEAQKMCSPLMNRDDPNDIFKPCRCASIDPSIYYERCIYDNCEMGLNHDFACTHVSNAPCSFLANVLTKLKHFTFIFLNVKGSSFFSITELKKISF